MSKYICNSCHNKVQYDEFYTTSSSESPSAVYAYCRHCQTRAWGGLNFHPAMNELFNKHFQPNWEYDSAEAKAYCKDIVLEKND
ncbi:hypothetical protein [Fusibacter sp. JL216-2]|uniref:hypothetical protein n=1 Tax=Fusibacter sp. JL216-2 TaxID=3071453 RepID=UPI003D32566D